MKLAIWHTGHQIADTVAAAFHECIDSPYIDSYSDLGNFGRDRVKEFDAHIGYGILRLQDQMFRQCDKQDKAWFNVDNGYFNPGHFDGYYRISYKGTQAKWNDAQLQKDIDFPLEAWRDGNTVLICPPTEAVAAFYNVDKRAWLENATKLESPYIIKEKDDGKLIPWDDLKGVITFNSSLGWQALQKGIPCISDPLHSIVGSYYSQNLIEYNFENVKTIDRLKLFRCMRAHQFTLAEIRQGDAWRLIEYYLRNK